MKKYFRILLILIFFITIGKLSVIADGNKKIVSIQGILKDPGTVTDTFQMKMFKNISIISKIDKYKKIIPNLNYLKKNNPELYKIIINEIKSTNEYSEWIRKNQKDTLEWQNLSTKIIFITMILLLVFGLSIVIIQIGISHKIEVEASKEGIKFKTASIGVIILALSFILFFLYIKFVYPISYVQ